MEYIEGITLRESYESMPDLSIERIINIIFQCAKALDYAGSNGIMHQDISPNKILISSNDEVKIKDFNFAKFKEISDCCSSDPGSELPFYTAPEVIRNEQPTTQSDIFSLGVIIYELLTGVLPFKGDSEVTLCYEILNKDPEPLSRYMENVPEVIDFVVKKALDKNIENRFQAGSELASVLSKSYDSIRFLDDRIELQEKTNALRNLKFFKDFSSGELNEVLETTQWLKYDAGDTIINEGEIDDSFYIIVLGDVVVTKNSKAIAALKQGDCFGEMAYLGKTRRAADIKALCRTVLMKVNSSIMEKTSLNTQNRFYKVFSKTLIQRLDRVNKLLIKHKS
jgi:serine/threonine protein kinase